MRVRHRAPLALVMASIAAAIIAYLPALNFSFISDDNFYISSNAKLAGLHWSELWRLLVEPFNLYEYLPLRDFSYWLDMTLFGLSPSAMRVHSMVLYLLSCLLAYGVTLQLWRDFNAAQAASAPWAAAAVTALFAIHPAHVEAVVWISGRKDVLSGLLSMLALWLALHARREQGLSAGYAAASVTALLAAMLGKATAVAVAPLIALLWLMFWRDMPAISRRRIQLLWMLAPLLLAAWVMPIFAQFSTVKLAAYWGVETLTRALAILGNLLRLALTPDSRHYFYPVFEDPWLPTMVALGVAVLLAAVAGGVMLWRRRTVVAFALLAFALLCLPYTQLAPYITHTLVADRFLFLALWPLMLLLVALAWRLQPVPRMAVLCMIALPWLYQTIQRPHDWRSLEALTEADRRAYPGSYFPVFKTIERQLSQGQYRAARDMANTITDAEIRTIAIKLVEGAYAVAVDAVMTGDPRDAIVRLRSLGILLQQPVAQAAWNTPLFSFWLTSRNILALEWATLAKNFPNDAQVRDEVKKRQERGL